MKLNYKYKETEEFIQLYQAILNFMIEQNMNYPVQQTLLIKEYIDNPSALEVDITQGVEMGMSAENQLKVAKSLFSIVTKLDEV